MAFKCVVGLGNPGSRYELTRHNLGFMVVEALVRKRGLSWRPSRFRAALAKDTSVIFVKPLTYMNNSGQAVEAVMKDGQIPPHDVLIIYDDLDLPLGKLRMRAHGSPGSHNGMRSVTGAVGREVRRLRLGIGPPPPHLDLSHFVLSPFGREEIPLVGEMVHRAVEAVEMWLEQGVEKTMGAYNG
ncbi:MAG: aminoacyl-tRNA hydrolase [Limnochordia bacterium]|jgi:PTH1 family peptidyl-tRNA hydrolase